MSDSGSRVRPDSPAETRMGERLKYIIVSPVKDEAAYIEETLKSVTKQTVLPVLWLIWDDGSGDGTPEIVDAYARKHNWIKLVKTPGQGKRNTGYAEVVSFNRGYEAASGEDHDVVVKLDGDLRLPEEYFQKLLAIMEKDPRLGILSGVYCEEREGKWETIPMPSYHAAGASKLYRRDCLEEIGGLPESLGWDSADEIKAMYRGWRTCHDSGTIFFHLKFEGSGMGLLRTNIIHGKIYYMTRGPLLFFLLKVVHRMASGRPVLLSGVFLLWGYLRAILGNSPSLLSREEARFHQSLLNRRLFRVS